MRRTIPLRGLKPNITVSKLRQRVKITHSFFSLHIRHNRLPFTSVPITHHLPTYVSSHIPSLHLSTCHPGSGLSAAITQAYFSPPPFFSSSLFFMCPQQLSTLPLSICYAMPLLYASAASPLLWAGVVLFSVFWFPFYHL